MMISIMVVEDKHPILRNLVKKIGSFSPRLQVIGEATDGITALEMCLRLKPQIVFTDIRMPGMDGLELITEIKKVHPDTLFIIISGYNDFEYAREALRLGVREFLLKPVTQAALNEVLENVTQLAHTHNVTKEQQLLSDLLRGRAVLSFDKYEQMNHKCFSILVICAGSISRFPIDLSNPSNDFWLKNDLASFLSIPMNTAYDNSWVFDGESMNEMVVVFSYKQGLTIDFTEIYNLFLSKYEAHEQLFTFAVSNSVENLSKLRLEYQLSRMILGKNAIFAKSSLLFVKDFSLNSHSTIDLDKAFDTKKIISFIKNQKREAFYCELETNFASWSEQNYTQSDVELCLSQILYNACNATLQKHIVNSDLNLELDEVISNSKDYPALLKNITFLFNKFFYSAQGSEPASSSAKWIVETVATYFNDHLSDEIAIADIADMVNLNVSFLSREFKKHKGSAPIEYLTQLRIEKAKLLIKDTSSNLKFKEIADMVGYNNQYYFSKVFKLITGLTPSEFKSASDSNLFS
ncbi:hypothetical protein R50345_09920 [Paenibacillus sp. FSL R5-0345]|uniref:response regulator transcription factor n=1 Tax=Paenibacillus sp. FSL R5-0345 TaxID=1536770 RepID=UPI0004F61080|nr:response regulator [Paenibacillus sp. FSL R5-0345]AIQ34896.1 hypothetical protein R50345_09920 [Paenibacillus sp. FSL R5-0345]